MQVEWRKVESDSLLGDLASLPLGDGLGKTGSNDGVVLGELCDSVLTTTELEALKVTTTLQAQGL